MALPPTRDRGAALVTGASSGIGEEFARQLAARGYNIVLVARRRERLDALAKQLGPTGVRVEVEPVDLEQSESVKALPDKVAERGLEVDLLVNNAGFGSYGPFVETSLESQVGQVQVNVEAVVVLSRLFLPCMIDQGRGAIVNIASVAALQPIPYEAVYAGSKAFVLNFTEALHVETRGTGVSVVAVSPGPVPTEWRSVAGYASDDRRFPPPVSPKQVVREALAAVEKDKRSIIPGQVVRLSMLTTRSLPNALKLPITSRMYRPQAKTDEAAPKAKR
jgi:short-subunit dehydrogenase